MTKSDFNRVVSDGVARGKSFLVVKIMTDKNPLPETIVNPAENVASKMAYYNKAYNDDLELINAKKSGKSVRIVDAIMMNNLSNLNWFAY